MSNNNVIEIKESQLDHVNFEKQVEIQMNEFENTISKLEEENKEKYETVITQANEINDVIFNKLNFDQTLKGTDKYEASEITILNDPPVDILQFADVRNWIMKKNPFYLPNGVNKSILCPRIKFDVKINSMSAVYKYLVSDLFECGISLRTAMSDRKGNVIMLPNTYLANALAAEHGILLFKLISKDLHSMKERNNIVINSDDWFTVEFIDARLEKDLFGGYTLRDMALFENERKSAK